MDAAQMENAKLMKAGNKHLPHGDLATYAQEAQGKVVTYEEDELKKTAGLTPKELAEAESLMKETGELDPNSRSMAQSRRAYIKELKKVVEAADGGLLFSCCTCLPPGRCEGPHLGCIRASSGHK